MSMSKKDFVELASRLRYELAVFKAGTAERAAAVKMIQAVKAACASINGRFDTGRFYEACGVTQEDLS